jgi:hypothetical protein
LHTVAIVEFGGSPRLRDRQALESAAATTTPAALVRSLVEGRPFVDGNRRTALLAGAYAHQLLGAEVTPEDLGVR